MSPFGRRISLIALAVYAAAVATSCSGDSGEQVASADTLTPTYDSTAMKVDTGDIYRQPADNTDSSNLEIDDLPDLPEADEKQDSSDSELGGRQTDPPRPDPQGGPGPTTPSGSSGSAVIIPSRLTVYGPRTCPRTRAFREELDRQGVEYRYVAVSEYSPPPSSLGISGWNRVLFPVVVKADGTVMPIEYSSHRSPCSPY